MTAPTPPNKKLTLSSLVPGSWLTRPFLKCVPIVPDRPIVIPLSGETVNGGNGRPWSVTSNSTSTTQRPFTLSVIALMNRVSKWHERLPETITQTTSTISFLRFPPSGHRSSPSCTRNTVQTARSISKLRDQDVSQGAIPRIHPPVTQRSVSEPSPIQFITGPAFASLN